MTIIKLYLYLNHIKTYSMVNLMTDDSDGLWEPSIFPKDWQAGNIRIDSEPQRKLHVIDQGYSS